MTSKLKIEYKKTVELIPYANNSRTHSEHQVAQIAASIKEFGFTNPVLLDADNGIIAGHGRVLAAQVLNLEQVPTIQLGHLSDSQKRAYVIADNKLALNAGWDEDILRLEVEQLTDAEKLLTGFDVAELNLMFNGWHADSDRIDRIEPKDSLAKEKIVISFTGDYRQAIYEAVTNAIDQLGLEDVEVS